MMLDEPHADALAMKLASVAIEAERLLRGLERAITGRRMKQDGTLTTDADLAAERLIISRIRQDWADVPVVAEETANAESPSDTFFLVDPLDGTGDFVHGTGEYSVNHRARPGRPAGGGGRFGAGHGPDLDRRRNGPRGFAFRRRRHRMAGCQDLERDLVSRRHGDEATEVCLVPLDRHSTDGLLPP